MALVWAKRRICWPAWLWLAAAIIGRLSFSLAIAEEKLPDELTGKVVGVHDGDTLTLLVDGRRQYKVRLDGIDAPEIGQDFGTQSKKALSSKVFGKVVRVTTHGRDKYGRVIGTIWLDDESINELMVAEGWAWHYVKYSDSETLAGAEREARAERSGLWAGKDPVAPWDWRNVKRAAAAAPKSKSAPKENRVARPPPRASDEPPAEPGAKFWLNTSSNVRHNASCRYFGKTKRGRYCGPDEGKACGICGG